MTRLVVDALVAFVRVSDWFATWVESVFRGAPSPTAGVAEPVSPGERGVPPASATGGQPHEDFAVAVGECPDLPPTWHPGSWSNSQLLTAAAELLLWLNSHPGLGPRSREGADNIRRELNHRAAQFRADEPTD